MRFKNINSLLLIILAVSVCTSCAAVNNIIEPHAWVGLLDLTAAIGIAVFILRGTSK